MRILTLGGKMLTAALRSQGHEVAHLGPPGTAGHPQDVEADFFGQPASVPAALRKLAIAFAPDWILQVDDSTPLVHAGLESLPFRTAWYAVDSHLHIDWHRDYATTFDMVFCAQRNRMADLDFHRLRNGAPGALWLPLACNAEPGGLPWSDRTREVAFVGTLDPLRNPARSALFDQLSAMGRKVDVIQGEYRPVYGSSRIVINQSVHQDLNLRCFEAMGQGALLITDRITHSLELLGAEGREFLAYDVGDADGLESKIRWALEHPAEAEAMARAGRERVAGGHMLSHRIVRLVESLAAHPYPQENPASAAAAEASEAVIAKAGCRLAHLAAAQEYLSRLALPASLTAFFAEAARATALAALKAVPYQPFALLALTRLDFGRGALAEALAWSDRRERFHGVGGRVGEEMGEGYFRSYATLRSVLLAHAGRMQEARRVAAAGVRDFPDDVHLQGLVKALGPQLG
ncbi:MAG: glycosyltransferase [Fibrobacteria bacterium]